MPPINHEHLQRCQRAACLSNCKWQAVNNEPRSWGGSQPLSLWALAFGQIICFRITRGQVIFMLADHQESPALVSAQSTQFLGSGTPPGNLDYKEEAATPKRIKQGNSREGIHCVLIFSAWLTTPWGQFWFPTIPKVLDKVLDLNGSPISIYCLEGWMYGRTVG